MDTLAEETAPRAHPHHHLLLLIIILAIATTDTLFSKVQNSW